MHIIILKAHVKVCEWVTTGEWHTAFMHIIILKAHVKVCEWVTTGEWHTAFMHTFWKHTSKYAMGGDHTAFMHIVWKHTWRYAMNGWMTCCIHTHILKVHLKVCNEWVDNMQHPCTSFESTPQGIQWVGGWHAAFMHIFWKYTSRYAMDGWITCSIHTHILKVHLKVCNGWVDNMQHPCTSFESTPQGMQWVGGWHAAFMHICWKHTSRYATGGWHAVFMHIFWKHTSRYAMNGWMTNKRFYKHKSQTRMTATVLKHIKDSTKRLLGHNIPPSSTKQVISLLIFHRF